MKAKQRNKIRARRQKPVSVPYAVASKMKIDTSSFNIAGDDVLDEEALDMLTEVVTYFLDNPHLNIEKEVKRKTAGKGLSLEYQNEAARFISATIAKLKENTEIDF